MSKDPKKHLLEVGINAAYMLSTDEDHFLVYEHIGQYLYQELKQYSIEFIDIYVIDEKGHYFQSEVVCDIYGPRQGYDVIWVSQYLEKLEGNDEIAQIWSGFSYFTKVPLKFNDQVIGIIDFHHTNALGNTIVESIRTLAMSLSVGIHDRLLSRKYRLQRKSIDMFTDVASHIQALNDVDELTTTFTRLIATHMLFDRVTVFLYDEHGKVYLVRCMNYKGEKLEVTSIPSLPTLDKKPVPLTELCGCWFPLYTNSRTIGVALFDNIYSSYRFPEWDSDVLLSLCNQFAFAVENINLFRSIQHVAQRDKLTSLYNRAYFEEIITQLNSHDYLPLSLIIGDVNGLKITNDVFGHLEGDNLLTSIAEILKSSCRPDDIIARWGGDEYIILLPRTDYETTGQICQNIQKACRKSKATAVQLSISLGYDTKTREDEDILLILKKAEDMMYYNKQIDREQFKRNFVDSVKNFLEERCDENPEHFDMLIDLANKFGIVLGLSEHEKASLKYLSYFHDVGKISINESLLKKQDLLSFEDWDSIKKHPSIGARIAQSSLDLSYIAEDILCHHERWDGKGYPQGKKGLEIPKLARIFAILDAYAVMVQGRPYKPAISHEEAVKRLEEGAASQFDPNLVDVFCRTFRDSIGY